MLRAWTKGKRKGLPFGVPMVWRKLKEHLTDCYFCLVNTRGIGKKNWQTISYPSIPSAIRPVFISNLISANISISNLIIQPRRVATFFWTAPSAASSACFYTMGIGMVLVTALY